MKATTLLQRQHRKVEQLFKKLGRAKSDTAAALVTELANDLAAHMVIEQDIFYPAAKSVVTDLVLESYEEHALAAYGLARLITASPEDESFRAKVTALKELIEHHVEEEEGDLFPKVEKALGEEQIVALGQSMKERFEQAVEAGYEKTLARTKPSRRSAMNGHAVGTAR